jgi:hypothetical protein
MAAIIACNVLLFAPYTIYAGNPDEFSASLASILVTYFLPAILFAGALALVGYFVPARGFPRFIATLAAFPVLMWAQGTLLVWDYGVLDGSPIDWLDTAWRGVIDTALWLTVILTALYGFKRFGKLIVVAATVTFAIQSAALGLSFLTRPSLAMTADEHAIDEQQYQAMFRFSAEKNVFHLVMDGFQSDVFNDIVEDPDFRHLRESLTGFTLFDQHIGTFPYTQLTVPLIVSGRTYRNEIPVDDFVRDTMQGDTILSAAKTAGFEIDVASQVALRKAYAAGAYTNTYDTPSNRQVGDRDYVVNDAVRLIDLSLFRLFPHFVKAYIYEDELWFVQSWFRDADYLSIRYFSELKFLEDMAREMKADREAPVYKLFHLMLSHRPTVGNEQCEYDGTRTTSRQNVTIQARCGLKRVVDVLNAMKDIGIYDNSLIVLMADHGAWVPAEGYVQGGDQSRGSMGGPSPVVAGMAVPVLAIKPPHSRLPMQISSAPTTIGDVPATIAALMGLDTTFSGRNAFDLDPQEQRVRTFFNFAYGKNQRNPGYLYPMLEYEVRGSPFQYDSWRKSAMRLPEGVLKTVD